MTVYIKPSLACGEITAPPSKSLTHRALICSALSNGGIINNIALSNDIKATLSSLTELGADTFINGNCVTVSGPLKDRIKSARLDVNESGSTLRFLIPIAMLYGVKTVFIGCARLFNRDLSVYEDIANKQGIEFIKSENKLTVFGKLKSGKFSIPGDISSQFVSGLMFALPLLEGNSFIDFTTEPESKPYIDMTVKVLSDFGISIRNHKNGYFIEGGQEYKSLNYTVEGDCSNSAFLDAFNLLGGDVTVKGIRNDTCQGDSIYKEFFKTIKQGGKYDLSNCPDLAPVMFALVSVFSGAEFIGTKRLKIKESDRVFAMKEELSKFGVEVIAGNNEVKIEKQQKLHSPSVPLCSHNDHRIVMALSVIASVYGGQIEGAEAVNKSYPDFFDDVKKLGIEVLKV